MTSRSSGKCVVAAILVGFALSTSVLAAGATEQAAKPQRIAIEVTWPNSEKDRGRTFRLVPLTPGPITAARGRVTGATKEQSDLIRGGERVATFRSIQTLLADRGTFEIRTVAAISDAGGGFQAGAITWSVRRGTGLYRGLRGGGHGEIVATPQGRAIERYEGFVSRS